MIKEINENGFWNDTQEFHCFDEKLCSTIIEFSKSKIKNIIDIGCGNGSYVKKFLDSNFECIGYDGNPITPEITDGLCKVMDLSKPTNLGKYDLAISLEVGEHIPKQYEQIFIDNVCSSSNNIIISWAVEGQGGYGHVNCQNNDYIIAEFNRRGYRYDENISKKLRENSTLPWFVNTLMYFEYKNGLIIPEENYPQINIENPKNLKFIIPVPDNKYYLWQILVQINNFRKIGYEIDTHYLVSVSDNNVSEILKSILISGNIKAKFHVYSDTREDKSYAPSTKPWLMAQYFKQYPTEKDNVYIYLDPDVIFLKQIDLSKFLDDDIWYESNTTSYLDSGYIKSKGEPLFYEMCDIVGIKPELVIENDRNCGGAQYITKNNTYEYWSEVEKTSVPLYKHMKDTAEKYHPEGQQHAIQAWTSEMWTTNWVLWKNGIKSKIIPELDFHWANHKMSEMRYAIFHNAGVVENNGIDFAKTFYVNSPFNTEIKGTPESISYKYIEEIKETETNFPEIVSKFKV